jgi:hypothetical protein
MVLVLVSEKVCLAFGSHTTSRRRTPARLLGRFIREGYDCKSRDAREDGRMSIRIIQFNRPRYNDLHHLEPARYSVAQNPLSGVRTPPALLVPRTGDTSRNTTQGKESKQSKAGLAAGLAVPLYSCSCPPKALDDLGLPCRGFNGCGL